MFGKGGISIYKLNKDKKIRRAQITGKHEKKYIEQ